MQRAVLLSAVIVSFVCATPAAAERWVSAGDKWFWLDMDSVQRAGHTVTFVMAHGLEESTPPDAGGSGPKTRQSLSCLTHMFSSADDATGAKAYRLDWNDARLSLLCPDAEVFCPLLKAEVATIQARAARKESAEVKPVYTDRILPRAEYCMTGTKYVCSWDAGSAEAATNLKARMARAVGACLSNYVRDDSEVSTGPISKFRDGGTRVDVGTHTDMGGKITGVSLVIRAEPK